jgi:hypothetical protein
MDVSGQFDAPVSLPLTYCFSVKGFGRSAGEKNLLPLPGIERRPSIPYLIAIPCHLFTNCGREWMVATWLYYLFSASFNLSFHLSYERTLGLADISYPSAGWKIPAPSTGYIRFSFREPYMCWTSSSVGIVAIIVAKYALRLTTYSVYWLKHYLFSVSAFHSEKFYPQFWQIIKNVFDVK